MSGGPSSVFFFHFENPVSPIFHRLEKKANLGPAERSLCKHGQPREAHSTRSRVSRQKTPKCKRKKEECSAKLNKQRPLTVEFLEGKVLALWQERSFPPQTQRR